MCLTRITSKHSRNSQTVKAWKVLRVLKTSEYVTPYMSTLIHKSEWNTSSKALYLGRLYSDNDHTRYASGFHAFATKRAAEMRKSMSFGRRIVVPVELKDVRTVGIDGNCKTYVAKKMRLISPKQKS